MTRPPGSGSVSLSLLPAIESLKDAFLRKFSCPPDHFERRLLRATLYPHARWLTLFGGYRSERFTVDRALLNYCGRLCSLKEIDGELREYAGMRENRQFSRRALCLRVSGRRLRRVAALCFAPETGQPAGATDKISAHPC